jgi:hypothetical protein
MGSAVHPAADPPYVGTAMTAFGFLLCVVTIELLPRSAGAARRGGEEPAAPPVASWTWWQST